MKRLIIGSIVVLAVAVGGAGTMRVHGESAQAAAKTAAKGAVSYPVFEVDPNWPKLPNGWLVGHVCSVAVDKHDHVFMLQRPNTLPEDKRKNAAPPVIEFDANGKYLNAWGGPGTGYDWPDSEHGIAVDYKDNVWIGGSSPTSQSLTTRQDDMLLKFTNKGKFLLQIGGRDVSKGNADTKSVHKSADVFVYPKTNEAFVADGYGNSRIIVFDADTGAFKRMWGAFSNVPIDRPEAPRGEGAGRAGGGGGGGARGGGGGGRATAPLDTEGDGAPQFGSPVHGVKVSNDGLVYVADRPNRRVQVFTPEGKYLTQVFINRAGPSPQSAAGVAFSPDKDQKFLYVADYGNSHVVVVDRKSLTVLYQFGQRSEKPGDFQGLHHFAVDSKGNIYTGEVAPGARAQRFLFKGMSPTVPANAVNAGNPTGQP
jgi:DNA-binding beta-propeller fold protein YncE